MMPVTVSDVTDHIPITAEVRHVATRSNSAVSLAGQVYDLRIAGLSADSAYTLKMQPGDRTSLISTITHRHGDPLEGFSEFQTENWDGEGAKAIDSETLGAARELIEKLPVWIAAPEAAPAADGSIGLEWVWQEAGRPVKVFIDVEPGRKVATFVRYSNGQTTEAVMSLDELETINHIRSLLLETGSAAIEAA
jgi:hypothetical protein